MCGIVGIINIQEQKKVQVTDIKSMSDSISHRGPDGEGQWVNETGKVGLGHRRLSIIDLSDSASQPMHYLNRYTIVFNGEIYNYIELRDQLEKEGYIFRSGSDTEVLLALYDKKKQECVNLLDGMFAFAIWDELTQQLFCARDRFGEKPFYYTVQDNRFYFGSEMKALWSVGIKKEPNQIMMYNYLMNGYLENPESIKDTFYQHIYKLPAASTLIIKDGVIFSHNYWSIDLSVVDTNISESEAKQRFQDLFETSVRRRLRSDVPVGSSLSGGLDSSLVVCMIDKISDGKIPQNTFSARFYDPKLDEGKYMQYVIDSTNVTPHFVYPDERTLVDDLDKVIFHQEEPFGSASILAQYKVFELAKQHNVTVLLDGQGADEVLAGYHYFYNTYFKELLSTNTSLAIKEMKDYENLTGQKTYLPKNSGQISLKNRIWNITPYQFKNYYKRKALLSYVDKFSINKGFFLKYEGNDFISLNREWDNLNALLAFKLQKYGLHTLLRYADRNSMANSREVRLPFLYHELVEFLMSLPSNFKIKNGWTKYIMRTSFESVLPDQITWRKDKLGYEPPQKAWLNNKVLIERIYESRKKLVELGVLNKSILSKKIVGTSADTNDDGSWRHLMLAAFS